MIFNIRRTRIFSFLVLMIAASDASVLESKEFHTGQAHSHFLSHSELGNLYDDKLKLLNQRVNNLLLKQSHLLRTEQLLYDYKSHNLTISIYSVLDQKKDVYDEYFEVDQLRYQVATEKAQNDKIVLMTRLDHCYGAEFEILKQLVALKGITETENHAGEAAAPKIKNHIYQDREALLVKLQNIREESEFLSQLTHDFDLNVEKIRTYGGIIEYLEFLKGQLNSFYIEKDAHANRQFENY